MYSPDGRLLTSPVSSLVLSKALEGAAIPGHLSPPLLIHPSIFSSTHPSHHLSIHPSPNHLPIYSATYSSVYHISFLQGDSSKKAK
uniref:Uncharacterized protein n=1 Tax=Saimiri boliviensis boliviensis TaxID=39432 RepID=A0A2K6TCA6_SAIBB